MLKRILFPILGRDNIKQRTIVDFESDERGAKLYAEYFGCEMDISAGNRSDMMGKITKNMIKDHDF